MSKGPEIVPSAKSIASVVAMTAQSSQKTPQERPKIAPRVSLGRPRQPNARPSAPKGEARAANLAPTGSQEARKVRPKSQDKRKRRNPKKTIKTKGKLWFVKDFEGPDPLQNEPRHN